ncbi:MAG: HEAT repeat domain-containing protein [Armatimonadota bacterium]
MRSVDVIYGTSRRRALRFKPRSAKAWVCVGLIFVACAAIGAATWTATNGFAHAEQVPLVLRELSASRPGNQLRLDILTDSSRALAYSASLSEAPNRLTINLPGVTAAPDLAPSVCAQFAGVTGVSWVAKDSDHPATDIVFDLSVAPSQLRYTVDAATAGKLVVLVYPPAGEGGGTQKAAAIAPKAGAAKPTAGTVRKATRKRALSPATHRRRTAKSAAVVKRAAPAPASPPAPAAAGPSTGTAPPAPAAAPKRIARPEPRPTPTRAQAPVRARGGRDTRPSSPPARSYAWLLAVLAMVVGAALATASWRLLYSVARARGRRLWLDRVLSSRNEIEARAAVRSASSWPLPDLRRSEDALYRAAQDPTHPAAREAGDLLREACPVEALAHDLAEGNRAARLRAIRLLALHPPDRSAEPLLQSAVSGPRRLQDACIQALAEMMRRSLVRPVLAALAHPDEAMRKAAVEVIQQAGPQSGPWLKRATADLDKVVRTQAVDALLLIRPEGTARTVAALLADPSDEVRAKAAQALGRLAPEAESAEALLGVLADPSPLVREAAGIALTQFGDESVTTLLTGLDKCASEHPEIGYSKSLLVTVASKVSEPLPAIEGALSGLNRRFAADLAAALTEAGVVDRWVSQLARRDSEERDRIVAAVSAVTRAGATEAVLRGLESSVPRVAESSARILGETRKVAAVQPLSRLLNHPDDDVRAAAAVALAGIDSADIVAPLASALADPAPAVRAAAASGIGAAMARPTPAEEASALDLALVTPSLLQCLRDPSPLVRSSAARALGSANLDDVVHDLIEAAMRDEDEEVRSAAMASLGKLDSSAPWSILLVEFLNDEDPLVRLRAMEILAVVGDPAVTEPLVAALQDADERVRATAGRGLWGAASQAQSELLVRFLASPDPKVRAGIAGALGNIRALDWAKALSQAADDPDPRVRAAIVNAFGRMGQEASEYLPTVTARFADTDGFVRSRAIEAAVAIAPADEGLARNLLALASDDDPAVREAAFGALVSYAKRGIYGPLVDLLANEATRQPVLKSLASADEGLVRQLLDYVQKLPQDVGQGLLDALAHILQGRWTIADLRPELFSLDVEARLAGLEGLALVGGPEAVRELARLLAKDPSTKVRVRAVEILSSCADDLTALHALKTAAQSDPDPLVRQAASRLSGALPSA